MEWRHVYPVNDLKPHDTTGNPCPCDPAIDLKNRLVVHNSYDGREAVEAAERILEAEKAVFCDCKDFGCTRFCVCQCHAHGAKRGRSKT